MYALLTYLGIVYVVDYDVVACSHKTCNWLLNSFYDHFGLHLGKNVRANMEFEVLKKPICRLTLSVVMSIDRFGFGFQLRKPHMED